MTNLFLDVFGDMAKLSPESEKLFMNAIIRRNVNRKTLLLNEGVTCQEIYFIEKGLTRTFYNRDGRDLTYWIAAENEFVGAMASFFSQKPSNKLVETLEDSTLLVFDYSTLEQLFSTSKELERMGRLFARYGITLLEQKFDNYHFLSARQRYDILLQRQPSLLQRVPLGIIASFLGVTQETLSRIRASRGF